MNSEVAIPPLIGVAPLMRLAFAGADLQPTGAHLLVRAQENPRDANALLDLSTVLLLTGNRNESMAVQAEAVALQSRYQLPSKSAGPGLRLLVLMGLGDLMANTPIEFLVEDSDVSLELMYLTMDAQWPETLPGHDVVLVAVGESDTNQALLARLAEYLKAWPRPVINPPERIAALSRDGVCGALAGVPGIDMPATVRVPRQQLQSLCGGATSIADIIPDGGFPIIVRPVGSHAGTNLEKIDAANELAAYLDQVPDEYFFVSRFVDYRGADGMFRKYRIVLIDGQPFICHYAISAHWMIHYLNAGMTESAEKRAEEAACMASFEHEFATRHAGALQAINNRMGLQYIGIDCAETPDGDLLIFEVDNAMVVHAMDPEDMFPYKKTAMTKVFGAFRRMLEQART
jgi:glutathione synthase/RimK-type ligase-like ATP-grasp enzyme